MNKYNIDTSEVRLAIKYYIEGRLTSNNEAEARETLIKEILKLYPDTSSAIIQTSIDKSYNDLLIAMNPYSNAIDSIKENISQMIASIGRWMHSLNMLQ